MAELFFWEALRRAQDEEMARDPGVIVLGEDVGVAGGTYKATSGLYDRYGAERVIDTPISEGGFTGLAVGASFLGMRPVVEIMSVNFAWLAMDQLFNTAAKVRTMSGGQLTAPMVMRSPGGTAHQLAAQHSARMEKVFMGIAGLRVVTPSTPKQAYGLLKAAIRSDDPVFIGEHERMYGLRGEVPDGEWLMPLEGSEVARPGRDLTIFGYNISTHWALEAAATLASEGIEAEVVDLYALSPLDRAGIAASVSKTHRALVVEEAEAPCGVGSEVMAIINEECFWALDAPPVRVSAKLAPVPYASGLEAAVIPDASWVVAAARRMFGR